MPRFRVGERVHDLATRTLVAATLDGSQTIGFAHRAEQFAADGADLLHVTASDHPTVGGMTEQEERATIVRAVAALAAVDVPVSVDVSHSGALAAACEAGATIGRDVRGFADPEYLAVAAACGASVVACRAAPSTGRPAVARVTVELRELAMRAEAAGLAADRVAVEPGWLGCHEFAELGYARVFSATDDRLARELRGLSTGDRGAAALAAVAYAVMQGCRILFVQDVRGVVRVVRMIEALVAVVPDLASAGR